MFKAAPLSSTFMVFSILGFLSSIYYFTLFGETWGTLFLVFFSMMFIASVISMTHAPDEKDLAINDEEKHVRKRRK